MPYTGTEEELKELKRWVNKQRLQIREETVEHCRYMCELYRNDIKEENKDIQFAKAMFSKYGDTSYKEDRRQAEKRRKYAKKKLRDFSLRLIQAKAELETLKIELTKEVAA